MLENKELPDRISVYLNKVNLGLKLEQRSILQQQSKENLDKISDKVNSLVNLILKINDDCESVRDAASILKKLTRPIYLCLLTDDKAQFSRLLSEQTSVLPDIRSLVLSACLVKAKNIANFLFGRYPEDNPKNFSYVLSYVISTGDDGWVKELVSQYKIDITKKEYAFELYCRLIDNKELLNYYKEYRKLHPTLGEASSTFFGKDPNPKNAKLRPKIPDMILQMFLSAFDGLLETLEDFDTEDRKFILYLIKDKSMSIDEVIKLTKASEQNNEVSGTLSSCVDILTCALQPNKWKYVDKIIRRNLFDNMAGLCFPLPEGTKVDSASINATIVQLKQHACKYVYRKVNNMLQKLDKQPLNYEHYKLKLAQRNEITNTSERVPSFVSEYLKELESDYPPVGTLIPLSYNYQKVANFGNEKTYLAKIDKDFWKHLKMTASYWHKIYDLVKEPPVRKTQLRDEAKMLGTIKAILYKQTNNSTWGSLPKWTPSQASVYYYYREWQRQNILPKIYSIISSASNEYASQLNDVSNTV